MKLNQFSRLVAYEAAFQLWRVERGDGQNPYADTDYFREQWFYTVGKPVCKIEAWAPKVDSPESEALINGQSFETLLMNELLGCDVWIVSDQWFRVTVGTTGLDISVQCDHPLEGLAKAAEIFEEQPEYDEHHG